MPKLKPALAADRNAKLVQSKAHELKTKWVKRRKELNITQEHLSILSGVAIAQIKLLESKKEKMPSLLTLLLIYNALGLDLKGKVYQAKGKQAPGMLHLDVPIGFGDDGPKYIF